jgi:predicted MPP superfamily phosphohydrolase
MALYAQHGMDLVLAGHTHGGVVRLPLFGGLVGPGHELLPKYAAGLHRMGSTQMYVSRGLGGAGPRLFNRPEVAILTLRGENTP